jgi:tetratricopeptide (TPR) repeat protein
MVKGKRITKKQLREPDEFITLTERAYHFAGEHGKKLIAGGILILVIILVILFYQMWERKKDEEAARAYGVASEMYERGIAQAQEGSTQDYKEIMAKFNEVVAKFPRTLFGKLSLIYGGNLYLRQGEYDEAIKAYSAFIDKAGKQELYKYFAWDGLGHAYEGKKDYGKAIEAYQKILDVGKGFQVEEAHLNIGYCYEKLGKSKEALENFKAYLKNSPKSLLANVISRKVSLLEKL